MVHRMCSITVCWKDKQISRLKTKTLKLECRSSEQYFVLYPHECWSHIKRIQKIKSGFKRAV